MNSDVSGVGTLRRCSLRVCAPPSRHPGELVSVMLPGSSATHQQTWEGSLTSTELRLIHLQNGDDAKD